MAEGVPPTVVAAGLPGYRVDDTAFRRLNPQYRERAGATALQAALQRMQLAKLVHGRLGVGVLALNLPAQVGPDMLGAVGRLVLGLCDDPLLRWWVLSNRGALKGSDPTERRVCRGDGQCWHVLRRPRRA